MKDCLRQQKQVETQLHLASIVIADRAIEDMTKSQKEYAQGLEQTVQTKQSVLSEMKKHEVEMRKLHNQEDTVTRKMKAKKDELVSFQTALANKQKSIDTSKIMIMQKKGMLTKI